MAVFWSVGSIPSERAEQIAAGIDRALERLRRRPRRRATERDVALVRTLDSQPGEYRVGGRRNWVRKSGGVWTADSPRMLFELLELVDQTGIGELVTSHLGERPALSVNKCTLRRVPIDTNTNWHQDGAFLGAEVRTLNLWLSLSHCGTDAPGLDIVPRRLDEVLETGTEGALFDWSVSPNLVDRVAGRHARRPPAVRTRRRAAVRPPVPAPHRGDAGDDPRAPRHRDLVLRTVDLSRRSDPARLLILRT